MCRAWLASLFGLFSGLPKIERATTPEKADTGQSNQAGGDSGSGSATAPSQPGGQGGIDDSPGWFVRMPSGKVNKLLNDPVPADALAKDFFDLDDSEQSVYRVSDEIEESETVAAHFLTLGNCSAIEERIAIRIYAADLDQCGIRVSDADAVPGDLGHASVDRRHHDLIGSRESFLDLATVIAHDIGRGNLRIRHVGKYQIYRQLVRFRDEEQLTIPRIKKKRLEHATKYGEKYKLANPPSAGDVPQH